MKRWGFTIPILVDELGNVIAGHCRLLAAILLGYLMVPVVVARGWTEAEKRAYCIADNQLAARASWDPELLSDELKYLEALNFNLNLIGFDGSELKELLQPLSGRSFGDPELAPGPPKDPVTRAGDTWLLGCHRVHCGDSTREKSVSAALGRLKARLKLMVTDPPYGVGYDASWRVESAHKGNHATGKVLNDDRADWRAAWALFPGDVAYVWHSGLFGGIVGESLLACDFQIRAQIIWVKPHLVLSRGDYHWQHEPCYYAVRKGAKSYWVSDRKQTTVWEISNNSAAGNGEREPTWGHSTQKPVECMRRPIENNSARGDVVYDPFLGSGTTLIAAEMMDRVCVGLELSPAYVDVIVRRWETFTGKTAILEATGQKFEDVASRRVKPRRTAARRTKSRNNDGGRDAARAS
jgi:DNA modification methylase